MTLPVLVVLGDELARARADADGEDLDAQLRGLVGHLERLAVGVLAVGEQQDHLRARGAALHAQARQQIQRGAHGAPDGRAAHRHVPGVEIAPEQLHGRVVGRGRVGQRLAREGHQADAIAGQAVHELLELALGALEARRVDVLGQHRAREVQRHDHVEARLLGERARPPACGRAQRQRHQGASASTTSAARAILRGTDTSAAIFAMSGASPRRASRRRRRAKASA